MAKSYKIKGRFSVGKGAGFIGAGTDVTSITKDEAKKYGIGAKEFDRLVERGLLNEDGVEAVKVATGPQHMSPERMAELVTAIGELDPENDDDYTNDGKPEVEAIKSLVEGAVSAADRDTAFMVFVAAQPVAQGSGDGTGAGN